MNGAFRSGVVVTIEAEFFEDGVSIFSTGAVMRASGFNQNDRYSFLR
jgi:hypothetical protein